MHLNTQVGQQLRSACTTLGARVIPAQTARQLTKWVDVPRPGYVRNELVLVVDWTSLTSALNAFRAAVAEGRLQLLGVIALCNHGEEHEAGAVAEDAGIPC